MPSCTTSTSKYLQSSTNTCNVSYHYGQKKGQVKKKPKTTCSAERVKRNTYVNAATQGEQKDGVTLNRGHQFYQKKKKKNTKDICVRLHDVDY